MNRAQLTAAKQAARHSRIATNTRNAAPDTDKSGGLSEYRQAAGAAG